MNQRPQAAVSIVLPTHNGVRFVRETLDSCLAQTFGDWELIVVDDCSDKARPQILAGYTSRDPRIRSNAEPLKLPAHAAKEPRAMVAAWASASAFSRDRFERSWRAVLAR